MEARAVRDLRTEPPRRWSERLDGICWLPRLIDKARAARAGLLGDYLFGQSPMDRALLRKLGLSHRAFAELVQAAGDDDEVIAAIARRDAPALERARAWSQHLGQRHRLFLWFIDVDDGYRAAPVRWMVNAGATWISRTAKRLWPVRR
jgi:hypothetical protein